MPIRAITFDFWRTLFTDGGPGDVDRERKRMRVEALAEAAGVSGEQANEALNSVQRQFLRVHIAEQRTLSPEDAIPMMEAELEVSLAPETAETLVETLATAILHHPPAPIDGAIEAIKATAERCPIGLISDTGISPGRCLAGVLESHGVRDLFQVLTFSDVVGVAKPQAAIFSHAVEGLGIEAGELLHIGDLEPTDIAGALRFGAQAGLFTADNDRFLGATEAQYTFTSWAEFVQRLPEIC